MRALAWDDKPEDYMDLLADVLQDFQIELVVVEKEAEFINQFQNPNQWDFVITDLLNEKTGDSGSTEFESGRRIAQLATQAGVPTFVVTGHNDRVELAQQTLPRSVIFKSKQIPVIWMAVEIREDLKRQGATDPTNVFLAYGQNSGVNQEVESYLAETLGIQNVLKLNDGEIVSSVKGGVLDMMSMSSAIIAICTPDDQQASNKYRARQNVIMEIGMGLALPRGSERLIILHQNSGRPETTVELPSDLGAELRIEFKEEVAETFDSLKSRLKKLRVKMKPKEGTGNVNA